MVFYEIRKLFQKRLTLWIFLLLILGNGYFAFQSDSPGANYGYDAPQIRAVYAALPEDRSMILPTLDAQLDLLYEGLYEENYSGPLLTGDIYSDRSLLSAVRERAEIVLSYDVYLDSVEQNAIVLQQSGIFEDKNSFGYRNIEESRNTYTRLRGITPEVVYSGSIENLSNSRLTDIALLLICLLLALELVYAERKGETMALIKPTAKGRMPILTAKLSCAGLILLLSLIILYGSNLLIGIHRFGMVPMDAPIQSVYGFENSSWRISVGQYLLLFATLKYLWFLGITALLFLLCVAGKSLLRILVGLCLCIVPSVLTLGSTGFFGSFNLVGAGNTESWFRFYRNLNLFGIPVSTATVSIAFLFLLAFLCGISAFLIHRRSVPTLSRSEKTPKIRSYRISISILRHEGYKFWISGGALILLVLLLGLQSFRAWRMDEQISPYDQIYVNYCTALEGEPNAEKDSFIQAEYDRFNAMYEELEQYATMLQKGEIDQNGYEMLCLNIDRKLAVLPFFERAVLQYTQAQEKGAHMVCLLGYQRLTGKEGRADLLWAAMLLTLALIMGLSGTDANEKETRMDTLIHTTIGEYSVRRSKGLLSAVYTLLCTPAAFVPYLLRLHSIYKFSGFASPASSVPELSIAFGTVAGSICFYGFAVILLGLGAAFWIRYLSRKIGNSVLTILLSAATLLLPLAALCLIHVL